MKSIVYKGQKYVLAHSEIVGIPFEAALNNWRDAVHGIIEVIVPAVRSEKYSEFKKANPEVDKLFFKWFEKVKKLDIEAAKML